MPAPSSNPFAAGCAWVNGEFVPVRDAKVSIFDAGFTRSDVTYDVVGVWHGRFFRLEDHLDRFARSVEQLRLELPVDTEGLAQILHGCVARAGLQAAYVDMICTRGVTTTGSRELLEHKNRLYAYAIPYVWIVPEEQQALGTDLVIASTSRRIPPQSVDPTVKNFHWGDFVRGQLEVVDRPGTAVVLPDMEGNITEGPGYNVFALVDGAFVTPTSGVLQGVTRRGARRRRRGGHTRSGRRPSGRRPPSGRRGLHDLHRRRRDAGRERGRAALGRREAGAPHQPAPAALLGRARRPALDDTSGLFPRWRVRPPRVPSNHTMDDRRQR